MTRIITIEQARAIDRASWTEAEFQRRLVELAKSLGWRHHHCGDSRRSTAGLPDLLLARDRVIFAELKRQKGKIRPAQAEWLHHLKMAGAEAYVWRPEDWDEILEVLR